MALKIEGSTPFTHPISLSPCQLSLTAEDFNPTDYHAAIGRSQARSNDSLHSLRLPSRSFPLSFEDPYKLIESKQKGPLLSAGPLLIYPVTSSIL